MSPLSAYTDDATIAYCEEHWFDSFQSGRLVYSVFTFVVQFVLPISLISFAHSAIKRKLQKLPSWQKAKQQQLQLMERTTSCNRQDSGMAAAALKTSDGVDGDVGSGEDKGEEREEVALNNGNCMAQQGTQATISLQKA